MLSGSSLLALLPALSLAAVHNVNVGQGGQTFSPKTLSVKTGDTVIFRLYPGHDVASGPFDSPCTHNDGNGAFFSGPFSDTDGGKKRFVVNVTSEDAVYFYCSVQRHCQSGMVGGWNLPGSGDTIDAYSSAARSVSQAETPPSLSGGSLVEEEDLASLTSSGSTTPSASPSPSESQTSSSEETGTSSSNGPSTTPPPSSSSSGPAPGSSPTSTGAADLVGVGHSGGLLAGLFGLLAWFL